MIHSHYSSLQACIRAYIARKHFETEQREYQRTREETEMRARKAQQEAELRKRAAKEELELRAQLAREAEERVKKPSVEQPKLRESSQSQPAAHDESEPTPKDVPAEGGKPCTTLGRQAALARTGASSKSKGTSISTLRRSESDGKRSKVAESNAKMIQVALGRLRTKEEETEKNLASLIEHLMKPTQGYSSLSFHNFS